MPENQRLVNQELLERCARYANIAKDVAIKVNGDATRHQTLGSGNSFGNPSAELPSNSEGIILGNTLSSDIGGIIFNRCLDGQPMNFRRR